MAAATIFGVLSGLGNTGEQLAEARDINRDEAVRKLAQAQAIDTHRQATETHRTQQQEAQLRMQREQQQLAAGKQPLMIGNPFTASGKQYARYQDPISGALSVKELPGPADETPEEKMHRGLVAIGIPETDASQAVIRKLTGRGSEKREVMPDQESPTGYSAIYYDTDGNEVWRAATAPPRYLTPTETNGSSTDPFGNVTVHKTIRRPLLPSGAPGGPVTPPGGQTPAGGATTLPRGPASAPSTASPAASGLPAGPLSVGTYKGLDSTGKIPMRPGLNPNVVQLANDILSGQDVTKILGRGRAPAEALARAYGWKGQGSLTPAQQMQVEQVDRSLAALSEPRMLKLFDSTAGRLFMSTIPLDPTGEGGVGGFSAAVKRGIMSQDQANYMNALTRLRGVIGGIRGFTGANNSNATAERLLAELPNFTNTKNSADAKNKIERLRQEVSIIKRLGYFLPGEPAGGSSAQPEVLPPAGAKVRDFTQLEPSQVQP